jgi:hypothetical protein
MMILSRKFAQRPILVGADFFQLLQKSAKEGGADPCTFSLIMAIIPISESRSLKNKVIFISPVNWSPSRRDDIELII